MRKRWLLLITSLFTIFLLAACGENEANDELHILEVEFDVPETLDIGETLQLEAVVTYGDEVVTDADEVVFEVWEKGDQDNSIMIDGENNEDGTYTAETSFDRDGIFEMYAHTTARAMHTMPKREIIVGEGGDYSDVDEDSHSLGRFATHFMAPENVQTGEETELMIHISMLEEPFTDLDVRYEIWADANEEDRDWVDASEDAAGEYIATYTFSEDGLYHIQVHIEDDQDLHEHEEHEIEVEN